MNHRCRSVVGPEGEDYFMIADDILAVKRILRNVGDRCNMVVLLTHQPMGEVFGSW